MDHELTQHAQTVSSVITETMASNTHVPVAKEYPLLLDLSDISDADLDVDLNLPFEWLSHATESTVDEGPNNTATFSSPVVIEENRQPAILPSQVELPFADVIGEEQTRFNRRRLRSLKRKMDYLNRKK
jgi:hypothetical protein